MKTIISIALALLLSQTSHATVIAIVDSGTDVNHKDLKDKMWVNAVDIDDAVDNDDNGLIDDINGWNFAENNNKLLDKKYLGTFSSDVYKFFEVQTRMLRGEATDADRAWYNQMKNNPDFVAQLGVFGNFVHGTHVAGLSAKNAPNAKIMGLKIIPTKSPVGGKSIDLSSPVAQALQRAGGNDQIIKMALKMLAAQQGKALAPIGDYLAAEKARVANCSFGTSTAAAKNLLGPLLKLALRREPTAEELESYSAFFVSEVVKSASALIEPTKGKTMFVIAAGNDGANNDVSPTSPANYKTLSTISVAATLGYKKLASFSNYGASMVEVAAPGVGIESSIPGDQYLTVSGTSQAAPFITNIVGLMLDENPNLSNSDIKNVLMNTSDIKDFLKGKVVSSGIANPARAVMAAKLAKTMQLSEAIQSSRLQVNDVVPAVFTGFGNKDIEDEGYVMPLPSLFN